MLTGLSAPLTLKEGLAEFLIPMNRYLAADMDSADLQPVLLRLESREKDNARVLTSRHVLLKQNKKGRFDLKPVVERQESNVQQTTLPVAVRRVDGNIYSVTTQEPLSRGEYALLFRKKSPAGEPTANVALKPVSPELNESGSAPPQAQASKGLGGLVRRAAPAPQQNPLQTAQPEQQITAFIAWDFSVLP
jgi:hypothetical protein